MTSKKHEHGKCVECGKRWAIVGFGETPVWLCGRCFDKAMAIISDFSKRLNSLLEIFHLSPWAPHDRQR
jgi:hypothetical protein